MALEIIIVLPIQPIIDSAETLIVVVCLNS